MLSATLRRFLATGLALCSVVASLSVAVAKAPVRDVAGDWRSYGRDAGGTRFSSLAQIRVGNVGQLRQAWTFAMRPADATTRRLMPSQMTPLAIGGILYLATPYGRLVALDGDSGRQVWSYTVPDGDRIGGRGLEYWPGAKGVPARLFLGTTQGRLLAVDVATGTASRGFAPVALKTPDVMNDVPDAGYSINSAPVVVGDVLVTGARVQESPAIGPAGDVRGWDVKTGRPLWTFHTIPRPGEQFHDSWGGDSWKRRSGVNVWNLMTVDVARQIVYLAIAAPAYDRIGVDRPGDNLFSDTLVALDARTGRRLWHFQLVHHDIWDMDVPGQPTLFDVRRNGRVIPAVAAVNKTGYVFLLDRVTGKPIFDVHEQPVPASPIPGEHAAPTQPIPSAPPPISRQAMNGSEITDATPALHDACAARIRDEHLTFAVPFQPIPADHPTIRFPGSGGGPNLGSGAFDPTLAYYVVPTTEVGSVEQVGHDAQGNGMSIAPGWRWFGDQATKTYCQSPPWGQLSAIDVDTGRIAWQSTLGITDSLPVGRQATGRPNIGGPIATAGGLIFIGATDDSRFRAFETRTGREVWTVKLGASAHATPITYLGASGRQYVAVVAAGGSYLGSPSTDSSLVVFALPPATRARAAVTPGAIPRRAAAPVAVAVAAAADSAQPGPSAAGIASGFPPGAEQSLAAKTCTNCHVAAQVTSRRMSRAQWGAVVNQMIGYGAVVPDQRFDALVDYLAKNFGPGQAVAH